MLVFKLISQINNQQSTINNQQSAISNPLCVSFAKTQTTRLMYSYIGDRTLGRIEIGYWELESHKDLRSTQL